MCRYSIFRRSIDGFFFTLFAIVSTLTHAAHPNLVSSIDDVNKMRAAINESGYFSNAYIALKAKVDKQIKQPITVPVPKDGGGGYTHERHKKNYQLMYNAGMIYQLSQDKQYAQFVRDMLLEYAKLYPSLGLHPKRKVKSQNPGKLFWQSLNEAVWLVYTIQAYDLIHDSLNANEIKEIEQNLLKPVAIFLSEGQPSTFNKVHNHGTWATAGVGMAGFVMNEPEWVEKALYDLDKSGKGGFLKQLEQLFSPQGYYNEGPYYQRYALMPFVTFAKAIENNQPERKIFEYRDGIVLKAITTTIELSYNGLFFPINDAIKSKGIDTIELVNGVTVAYGLTRDSGLLDIANQQKQIILTGDGLKVAKALDAGLATPYQYQSVAFGDGADGNEGALVVMRQNIKSDKVQQALLFKPAAQGLGHGHFDKLTWQFYDRGNEIVSDYGAARFLNVEAKFGGRYLPENNSYAKQTIAHNTVVVDERSHFDADVKVGNKNHPELLFFTTNDHGSITSAKIDTAYQGVTLKRTLALVNLPELEKPLAFDIFLVKSDKAHQIDLPLHYKGQLIDTSFKRDAFTKTLKPLGAKNGYQHLWLTAQSKPNAGLAQITWLNNNGSFYTQSSIVDNDTDVLFTRLGANDPNFNLRNESAFIYRKKGVKKHTFVSVLEPHGQYNPAKEFTLSAQSELSSINYSQSNGVEFVEISLNNGSRYLFAITNDLSGKAKFSYNNVDYQIDDRFKIIQLKNQQ
ncbi:alginate lyase family protein [Thalassotalea sp. M1531]|uniref:Alginate lyase family protein n=1 Tax=Thalassotalea algicola TaxID=2716224 RepID=A0A7Y0LDK9_9GAMM|nr:heparinase II/III family protein [Thalassotalea algicola]NMP32595.1 alginate lyase family protein [Thalassotalea algicola]